MTDQFSDSFARTDRSLDDASETNWNVVCGSAAILDNEVVPISVDGSGGFGAGISPVDLLSSERTQVFYTGALDRQDQSVRAVFGHDENLPSGTSGDASFTLLARASKDPLLLELGGTEEPDCFDQAYAVRFTAQNSATEATLSILKLIPEQRVNSGRAATGEPDDAIVLKTIQLQAGWLSNRVAPTDPTATTGLTYTGMWQDLRMRVYGSDGGVTIEVYLNERFEQNPILVTTDRSSPTWDTGSVGFEFRSPAFDSQPLSGASPFGQAAASVMRCTLFEVQTISAFAEPRTEDAPRPYGYVVDRVLTLVEKNGEAQYLQTQSGRTRRAGIYLDFVLEAEAHIIRTEGYWEWLRREAKIYLVSGQSNYEMPADFGELDVLRPGNYQGRPLESFEPYEFRNRLGGITRTGGLPRIFTKASPSVNLRPRVEVFPVPTANDINGTQDSQANPGDDDIHMVVEYYKKRLRPNPDNIDTLVPVVPQQHLDVLIYGATAHAVQLDSSQANVQNYGQTFMSKLQALRRSNNRNVNERVIIRSAADVFPPSVTSRIPQLRSNQLEVLLI